MNQKIGSERDNPFIISANEGYASSQELNNFVTAANKYTYIYNNYTNREKP